MIGILSGGCYRTHADEIISSSSLLIAFLYSTMIVKNMIIHITGRPGVGWGYLT